jgi:hypothetical protein
MSRRVLPKVQGIFPDAEAIQSAEPIAPTESNVQNVHGASDEPDIQNIQDGHLIHDGQNIHDIHDGYNIHDGQNIHDGEIVHDSHDGQIIPDGVAVHVVHDSHDGDTIHNGQDGYAGQDSRGSHEQPAGRGRGRPKKVRVAEEQGRAPTPIKEKRLELHLLMSALNRDYVETMAGANRCNMTEFINDALDFHRTLHMQSYLDYKEYRQKLVQRDQALRKSLSKSGVGE